MRPTLALLLMALPLTACHCQQGDCGTSIEYLEPSVAPDGGLECTCQVENRSRPGGPPVSAPDGGFICPCEIVCL